MVNNKVKGGSHQELTQRCVKKAIKNILYLSIALENITFEDVGCAVSCDVGEDLQIRAVM